MISFPVDFAIFLCIKSTRVNTPGTSPCNQSLRVDSSRNFSQGLVPGTCPFVYADLKGKRGKSNGTRNDGSTESFSFTSEVAPLALTWDTSHGQQENISHNWLRVMIRTTHKQSIFNLPSKQIMFLSGHLTIHDQLDR